jgi:adenylate cyclase
MEPSLDLIRPCLEGVIPGVVATCSADGIPNVAYLSQVEYVDPAHLALSFQFFNKTRHNVRVNARAELLVIDPRTGALYRIRARYLRTETEGTLFERMKAKLAGIASHTGMSGVFRLLGSDVYAVEGIEQVSAPGAVAPPPPTVNCLAVLRKAVQALSACVELEPLLDTVLDALTRGFGIEHAMLLLVDAAGQRLYTVASRGYGESGAGSEIPVGEGVIGVAARMRTPIRINHLTHEYAYSRAMRSQMSASGGDESLEREIPLPGLCEPHSQVAVPLMGGEALLGVLFAESEQDMRFSWDDEDALVSLAQHLGLMLRHLQQQGEAAEGEARAPVEAGAAAPAPCEAAASAPLRVRYFEADASVFLDDDYLIKGVAGAILWKLLRVHAGSGRTDFSNRELRLSPDLRLPDVSDNLEARLLLLSRRLQDRQACVRIERTGRGRFRLCVARPLQLVDGSANGP